MSKGREKGYKNKTKNASKIIKNNKENKTIENEEAVKLLCEKWGIKLQRNEKINSNI
tara:strand:+ start:952 stop:1122 length:171 start_codon:yes stop_codon:yes gene_type:complete